MNAFIAASAILMVCSAAQAAVPAVPADSTRTAASSGDAAFLAKAIPAGRDEVAAAHNAMKASKSDAVKQAAQMLQSDHRAANQKLEALAAQKGLPVPPQEPPAAMSTGYSDRDYIAAQIKAHQEAIALFTDEATNGSDADLRAFAHRTLPTLRNHLMALQSLQSS